MARLYLFAEGQTEQTFADIVLKPHLANFEVYLNGPVLVAHARKKGKVHRGGGRRYGPMKTTFVGSQVAQLIGLEVIRAKCPHFAAWIKRLEDLATFH